MPGWDGGVADGACWDMGGAVAPGCWAGGVVCCCATATGAMSDSAAVASKILISIPFEFSSLSRRLTAPIPDNVTLQGAVPFVSESAGRARLIRWRLEPVAALAEPILRRRCCGEGPSGEAVAAGCPEASRRARMQDAREAFVARWMGDHVEALTEEFFRIASIPGQLS